MDNREQVRAYYTALDNHEYGILEEVLAPEFVHERPDRTLGDREEFVTFMRDERPISETTHEIEEVYDSDDGSEVLVRGRLFDDDGEELLVFVDRFVFDDGRIGRLQTFTPR